MENIQGIHSFKQGMLWPREINRHEGKIRESYWYLKKFKILSSSILAEMINVERLDQNQPLYFKVIQISLSDTEFLKIPKIFCFETNSIDYTTIIPKQLL